VVIGPTLLKAGSRVPSLLEFGGEAQSDQRRSDGTTRTLRYRPRPFMRPAFEAEAKSVSEIWRNSITR
jgi:hypothetical protein